MFLLCCFVSLISYQIAYTRPINTITDTTNAPGTQGPTGKLWPLLAFTNISHNVVVITELPATNSEADNELKPIETQKAVCTVTSGDVRASAEAFTTRELKGVCGSTEMLAGFNDLELRLSKELQDLKALISDLHRHFLNHSSGSAPMEPITAVGNMNFTPMTFKFQPIQPDNKLQKSNEIRKNYYMIPKFKSLETKGQTQGQAVRGHEISKFNNTLVSDQERNEKVYSYYWRMENCTKHLKDGNSIGMESPVFSIKGTFFFTLKSIGKKPYELFPFIW